MATQKGFEYEQNAYKELSKLSIATGSPAGASSDRPDLENKLVSDSRGFKSAGCELKILPTAAGSLVMKYTKGKWSYGDYAGDPEKELLQSIGEKYKLLANMNSAGAAGKNWRGKVPSLQNDATGRKILVGAKTKLDAYNADIKKFGGQNEIHIDIEAKAICDYYNSKDCQYINVGTHGFYLLNNSDPLKLNTRLSNKIPDFAFNTSARIRVRCQSKGGGDYQFVMTLDFGRTTKSPYNLAPLATATSVAIDNKALLSADNKPLIQAFNPKTRARDNT